MTGDAVERVLDSILQERGGASMFSTHALAAASALAHALVLMAEGDLSRAPALGALTALLPPVVKPEDRFDFSLLSDRVPQSPPNALTNRREIPTSHLCTHVDGL